MGRVLAIVGATATGKSALALALAAGGRAEIINADARQVYRGFDIGTAKPTAAERRRVPHHLLDILDAQERFSAGEFARRALEKIGAIHDRGAVPIVVGGTGFYLRALFGGLSELPPMDRRVRRGLERRLESEGLEALREELDELDPATCERVAAGDRQRILRALEVVLSTGKPLSEWVAERPRRPAPFAVTRVGLTMDRALLYHRVEVRVASMVEAGWVEEVKGLLERGLDPALPAFESIGYRQLARHLQGCGSRQEALGEAVRETRRLAKRQGTWFRREPQVTWFDSSDQERTLHRVQRFLEQEGLGDVHGKTVDQHPRRVSVPEPEGR